MMKILTLIILVSIVFLAACSNPTGQKETEGNIAVVTDRTGREWDVTHARDVYGLNPDFYNFGLGTGAIASVDSPRVIRPGEEEYPAEDSQIPVFGVNHNGEQRAYSVGALTRHEVFNDVFPGDSRQFLAVTY
jgi:hypothetical protein